jgi:hypothetical protein
MYYVQDLASVSTRYVGYIHYVRPCIHIPYVHCAYVELGLVRTGPVQSGPKVQNGPTDRTGPKKKSVRNPNKNSSYPYSFPVHLGSLTWSHANAHLH